MISDPFRRALGSLAKALEQYFLHKALPSELFYAILSIRRELIEIDDRTRSTWSSRRDMELIDLLNAERLSKQEFELEWRQLWNHSPLDVEVGRLVDLAHSCVDYWTGQYVESVDVVNEDIDVVIDTMTSDAPCAVSMRRELDTIYEQLSLVLAQLG